MSGQLRVNRTARRIERSADALTRREDHLMLSLKKKSAAAVLSAGLALSLAACGGSDDDTTATSGSDTSAAQAEAEPAAQIDQLSGKQTAVTLDPAFVEGITGLGLTPGVIGGATFDGAAGKVAFPITGGNVTYFDPASGVEPYVQGKIEHFQSGLELKTADTTVTLRNFVVDPAESLLFGKVLVNGQPFPESGEEVPLFFLDGRTLNPLQVNESAGTAVLEGTTVSLTKTAADALNMVFGTDALTEFFPVGVAEITVDLPK
jgi:hypothetical protein